MEAENVIKFVPVEVAVEIAAAETTASEPAMENTSSEVVKSYQGQGEQELGAATTSTARAKVVRAKANTFVKKGDIVPCIAEQGGYWLFHCSS